MKTLSTIAILSGLLVAGFLTSCNTIAGMGQDLNIFGAKVANSNTAKGISQEVDKMGNKVDETFTSPREREMRATQNTTTTSRY